MSARWGRRLGSVMLAGLLCAGAYALFNRPGETTLASYSTPLEGRTAAQRHNADLAMRKLDGAVIGPGEEFSFNTRVGTFSRDQGYRRAPVSYNGQLIDSWGGGVCQASTTLYNAALYGGMEILERHRHRFQPSYVPPGRDAAVAFHNIDLRFRNPHPFPVRLACRVEPQGLRVSLIAPRALEHRPEVVESVRQVTDPNVFRVGGEGRFSRVRNSGKQGYEVQVYRIWNGRRELISEDSYPVMHRIVETGP